MKRKNHLTLCILSCFAYTFSFYHIEKRKSISKNKKVIASLKKSVFIENKTAKKKKRKVVKNSVEVLLYLTVKFVQFCAILLKYSSVDTKSITYID